MLTEEDLKNAELNAASMRCTHPHFKIPDDVFTLCEEYRNLRDGLALLIDDYGSVIPTVEIEKLLSPPTEVK